MLQESVSMRKTGFQLMRGQVDNEEYLRVSEIAEKRGERSGREKGW